MSGAPLPNGPNRRPQRNKAGRLLPGNSAAIGRGNPYAAKVNAWRGALAGTVSDDDVRVVLGELLRLARSGNLPAIRELLDRCLGKPEQAVSLTSKAALEQASRLARDMALLAARYMADDQRRAYSTELRRLLEQAEIEVPI